MGWDKITLPAAIPLGEVDDMREVYSPKMRGQGVTIIFTKESGWCVMSSSRPTEDEVLDEQIVLDWLNES